MQNHTDKKLNFVFWGTPDVASETLEILKKAGFLPSLIITSPDAKSGRGLHLQASPAAIFAQKNKIPCLKPSVLDKKEIVDVFTASSERDGARKAIRQQADMRDSKNIADFFLVVAYGKIIPESILKIPTFGSINIHYSLLPKYRGASPVESAILNGDRETGVTIQKMEYKMDSGPILAQEEVIIDESEKAAELRTRLIKIGGELLVKILPDIGSGKIKGIAQNEKDATYCKKIKKEDGLIDLNDDAIKNYNKFRGYALWPRIFFFQNNKRIIVSDAALENNQFIIKKVLPEGKKEIKWEEFKKKN